jgi:hypothetical protein
VQKIDGDSGREGLHAAAGMAILSFRYERIFGRKTAYTFAENALAFC